MVNVLSIVMPKLAVIIPLALLAYFCYAIYQNKNIASQDKRIYSEGIEEKARIVNIEYSKNKYSSGIIVATLTVLYLFKGEEINAIRTLKYEIHQSGNVTIGSFVRVKFIPDDINRIVFLDYKTI
ncbi:hypothetical protein [Serratia rubidaea]|uniref:DUF3592 domain-containing protein n=1 Tax=Serratia rubidaea TaxID=61652 RepID=A0ABS0MHG4_SERRU|nr:hypothetical protein [Serratia rubidaea]MBH1931794.1 hypothetical protein [Serratia rubidaea]